MQRHVDISAELKSRKLDETLIILEEQLALMEAELQRAERDLEVFRITTISLPTEQGSPIASGLTMTQNPVFDNYFDMKVQAETIGRDISSLEAIAERLGDGPVPIEALEVIPPAASSSELRKILDELVSARSELRAFEERYQPDYPPIQDLMARIRTIENESIPRLVDAIIAQLRIRQSDLQGYVDVQARDPLHDDVELAVGQLEDLQNPSQGATLEEVARGGVVG